MALSSRVLRRITEHAEDLTFISEVEEDVRLFNDQKILETNHWSSSKKRFFDYGTHSTSVHLIPVRQAGNNQIIFVRQAEKEPIDGYVDDVYGYINLFPFLLKLLLPDSEKLGIILENLNRTEVSQSDKSSLKIFILGSLVFFWIKIYR